MPSLQRCSSNYLVSLHTPWLVQRRPTRALSGLVVCTGAADAVSRTEKACAALKNEIDEMSSQLVLVRAQKLTAQEQLRPQQRRSRRVQLYLRAGVHSLGPGQGTRSFQSRSVCLRLLCSNDTASASEAISRIFPFCSMKSCIFKSPRYLGKRIQTCLWSWSL